MSVIPRCASISGGSSLPRIERARKIQSSANVRRMPRRRGASICVLPPSEFRRSAASPRFDVDAPRQTSVSMCTSRVRCPQQNLLTDQGDLALQQLLGRRLSGRVHAFGTETGQQGRGVRTSEEPEVSGSLPTEHASASLSSRRVWGKCASNLVNRPMARHLGDGASGKVGQQTGSSTTVGRRRGIP